jgi:restriction endonuclease S subunit
VAAIRTEPASREEIESGEVLLLDRISFDEGRVFAGNRTETKMLQKKAHKGDIVVSKINAKKGAIGIVESTNSVGTTIHFRVLIPDNSIVLTKFLHLGLRSTYCRNQFEILTGGQGKGEISEERLLSVKVPVPPRPIQQKIVAHWEALQLERASGETAMSVLVAELNSRLAKQTNGFDQVTRSKVLLANYENIQQWDVKAGRSAAFITANPDFIRLGDYTEECTETVKPWEEPEKEWPIYGVNNKEGIFLSSMQAGKDFNAPYKKIEKDWFFHNPTRANVGSLGIVPEVPKDAITSPEYQVWRLKKGFLPDFMALMLRTDYFLALVAFNRVGGVKQRMYYGNLAEIRLPEISVDEQRGFVERRQEILANITAANENQAERKNEIEKMILGKRPVEMH